LVAASRRQQTIATVLALAGQALGLFVGEVEEGAALLARAISLDPNLALARIWNGWIFSQAEDLLPVISFGSKKDGDTEKKHGEFVQRMVGRGYTERQVRRLVEWYMRVKQAG
jgi:predicted Ser/Thr protein kinase